VARSFNWGGGRVVYVGDLSPRYRNIDEKSEGEKKQTAKNDPNALRHEVLQVTRFPPTVGMSVLSRKKAGRGKGHKC
jgi:hypothetical protein